jgi:hypothetical protein
MKKVIDPKKLLFENMAKLNPDFKEKIVIAEEKKEVLTEDKKWIQKAVNPEHKGFCTPMTKPTCTPQRKALAKRFKKGIEDEGIKNEGMLDDDYYQPNNPEYKAKLVEIKAALDEIFDGQDYGIIDWIYKMLVRRTAKPGVAKPENVSQPETKLNEDSGMGTPINKYVMFGYNYPPDFIEQVWVDDPRMAQHFKDKFMGYYDKYGAEGVMNAFYVNLSGDHQKKLEDWITANYNGN